MRLGAVERFPAIRSNACHQGRVGSWWNGFLYHRFDKYKTLKKLLMYRGELYAGDDTLTVEKHAAGHNYLQLGTAHAVCDTYNRGTDVFSEMIDHC